MSNLVLFCENYGQIKYVLRLVELNIHDHRITLVFPGFPDLLQFFQVINQKVFNGALTIIHFEKFTSNRSTTKGIRQYLHVLPDILQEKRHLKNVHRKYLSRLENTTIYFFTRGFSGTRMYLLDKLKKKNRLVYFPPDPPDMVQARPRNLTELASLIIKKCIYGYIVVMGELSFRRGFPYLPDRFINRYAQAITQDEKKETMKGFDFSRYKVFDESRDYSAIYFDDGLITAGLVDEDTCKREIKAIFDIITRYYPEKEIAAKYHPDYAGPFLPVPGTILPQYIPAELLYFNSIRLYLSIISWSIVQVTEGTAVSLVDLITFKDDRTKNELKSTFTQDSNGKVLFPASLEELDKIISGMKLKNS